MSKKSHHFLMLWPWPLTYDLEKLIRSGHYHYQCVYQIWEQSIQWFLSYRVNTIAGGGRRAAGGGRRAAGGGRLRRKTITSPDPSDTGDIIIIYDTYLLNLSLQVPLPLFRGEFFLARPRARTAVLSCHWVASPVWDGRCRCAQEWGTHGDQWLTAARICLRRQKFVIQYKHDWWEIAMLKCSSL